MVFLYIKKIWNTVPLKEDWHACDPSIKSCYNISLTTGNNVRQNRCLFSDRGLITIHFTTYQFVKFKFSAGRWHVKIWLLLLKYSFMKVHAPIAGHYRRWIDGSIPILSVMETTDNIDSSAKDFSFWSIVSIIDIKSLLNWWPSIYRFTVNRSIGQNSEKNYKYTYICIHLHIRIRVHPYAYTYRHMYTYTNTYTYMYTYIL